MSSGLLIQEIKKEKPKYKLKTKALKSFFDGSSRFRRHLRDSQQPGEKKISAVTNVRQGEVSRVGGENQKPYSDRRGRSSFDNDLNKCLDKHHGTAGPKNPLLERSPPVKSLKRG